MTDIVPIGTAVTYHGSIISQHGDATVTARHRPFGRPIDDTDVVRYVLVTEEGHQLENARRQSFTVKGE